MIYLSRVLKPPEERRAELIQVASKLFFEKGYTDTTVRDIIKEIQGSQGMFYHYFSSKDEIYRAVMEDYIDSYIIELNAVFYKENISIKEKLLLLMNKFRSTFNVCLNVMDNSTNTDNVHFTLELKSRIVEGIIEPIQHLIEQLINLKIIKRENILKGDTYLAAAYIAHGISGIVNSKFKDTPIGATGNDEFQLIIYYSLRALGIEDISVIFET